MIRQKALSLLALAASCQLLAVPFAQASIPSAEQHVQAGGTKKGQYLTEGYFTGGHRSVTAVKLRDIRRAKAADGYERIVLDLEGAGEAGAQVPYFQVQMAGAERRIVLSIWADVAYDFDAARVRKAFAKSAAVKRLNVMPRLEDGLAIIEFVLNAPKAGKAEKLEVFQLGNPGRIIMDVL